MQLLNSAGCALSKGYPIAVSAVKIVVVYLSEQQQVLLYCSSFFPEFEKYDGTKRSKSSSFSFKQRRHTAWRGPEGYNKDS